MMAQPRPTLSQQLVTIAEALPAGPERVAVRHASLRARRLARELETARVALHNLDMQDCARCGEWYGIGALSDDWCNECIAAAKRDAYEDRRELAREDREVRT